MSSILKNKIFLIIFSSFYFINNASALNIKELSNNITNNILGTAITLLMAGAFLFFFYGGTIFIWGRITGKGDLKDLEKGREFMLWGVISLFVIMSAWGIIKTIQDLLDINGAPIEINTINITYSKPESKEQDNNPFHQATNKPVGADCVGQSGKESQCESGVYCRDVVSGNTVKEGETGVCKKTQKEAISGFDVVKSGYQGAYIGGVFSYLKYFKCIPDTEVYKENDDTIKYSNKYNDNYKEAIKAFQKLNQLSPDGLVGIQTWQKLTNFDSKPCQ